MRKILLGEISSYKAIVIAKFLKEVYDDLFVIGYDYKNFSKKVHTKYCDEIVIVNSPEKNITAHLKSIEDIIKNQNIDLFIPVDSSIYDEFIKAKDKFGKAFDYVGGYDVYEKLHNKAELSELAFTLSLRIPNKYSKIEEAKLPFVIKPPNLSSSKGVEYIFSETKKKKVVHKNYNNHLFQEYVEGKGCGYSVYAKDGKIITGYGHLRLAEFPVTGGSSVYRTSFESLEMIKVVEILLENTKWTGFAMFEFKLLPSGELVLIEVNPRIWGSINQGLQNGINYFEFLLGRVEMKNRIVKHTYLSPLFYQSMFNYLLKFRLKPLLIFLKNLRNNHVDISFINDFSGFLSTILRKLL